MGILKPPSPLADPKNGLSASVLMEKQQAAAASAAAGASNDGNRLAEPRLSDDTKSSGGSHYRWVLCCPVRVSVYRARLNCYCQVTRMLRAGSGRSRSMSNIFKT